MYDVYFKHDGDNMKFTLSSKKALEVLKTQSENVIKNFKGTTEKSIVVNVDQKNKLIAWCVSHKLKMQTIR